LCGFLVVLDYDEMNCNLVFGISYNVLWSVNSSCNNHESNIWINHSVKFIEN
jgi:hypothetical protein